MVGDTLARLTAGANENAGTDMGVVIERFDTIINECNVHFMLIHHLLEKNTAAGARGWSGVRAAVDTEIEVTENAGVHCAEITKQRDLGSKGERIGFKLKPIEMGFTKWKKIATNCVVLFAEAPTKQILKKTSEAKGAIIEYFLSNKGLIKRADLVRHFIGRYSRSGLYGEIDKMILNGNLKDEEGFLKLT